MLNSSEPIIKNRKNQDVFVSVEVSKNQKELIFISHGLGGSRSEEHIKSFVDTFREKEFTVISFDCTNSLGESYGNYENATDSGYYEDLEDVIEWAKDQAWYQEKFWLCGYSLGGLNIARYAKENSDKVKTIISMSPTISAEILETKLKSKLKEVDGLIWYSYISSRKNREVKLKWAQFIEDLKKYDLVKFLENLKIPTLILVGEKEYYCEHLKDISKKLNLEFGIIKNAQHVYSGEEQLKHINEFINKFINESEEILDWVDENDKVIGTVKKSEKKQRCASFRLSIIMVENDKKELLLGLRSRTNSKSGKWHVIGGHVQSEESYEDAAKRELMEEAGFESDLKLIHQAKIWEKRGAWVFCSMFLAKANGGFKVNNEEFDELKFFSVNYIKNNPEEFSEEMQLIVNDYLNSI